MKQGREMTPFRRRIEEENLRRAIWRWYRHGGSYGRVIEICDMLYATKISAALDRILPKKRNS
jgi:hypothetical protein